MEVLPVSTRLWDYIEYEVNGAFTTKDAYNACKIYTLCEKECEILSKNPTYRDNRKLCAVRERCIENDEANIRMQLRKLADPNNPKQLLEKSQRLPGVYRKIDKSLKRLDIINAQPGVSVDLRFPCGLERVIRIVPKTLIIIAGATGAGKSAYLLNTALINLDKPIHYFANNEMTANRIKERVLDYEHIGSVNMDNFNAYERESGFADVVIKDGINIIDYVSVPSDRPSSIEDMLKDIVAKLTTGICFAAVQKKGNYRDVKGHIVEHDLGVGGEWTKRVPSVYLTMDHKPENILKIQKSKERVDRHINPEGMEWKFKLVNGISFKHVQDPDDLLGSRQSTNRIGF